MAQLQQIHSYTEFPGQKGRPTPLLSPEEARQGVISGHVVTVLVASLILALLAGVVLYVAYF